MARYNKTENNMDHPAERHYASAIFNIWEKDATLMAAVAHFFQSMQQRQQQQHNNMVGIFLSSRHHHHLLKRILIK
jgi:hypothetical protein